MPNIAYACQAAKVDRSTPYKERERNQDFAEAWRTAIDDGIDRMEQEAHRRAVEGCSRPVYQGKELVGHIQEYSDTLMIFLLKAHRPEKYRERLKLEGSGDGGTIPIQIVEVARPNGSPKDFCEVTR